jgi:hypothetical protein
VSDDLDQKLRDADLTIANLRSSVPAPPSTTSPEWWSVADAMTISVAVLIFGLLVIGLAGYLIHTGKQPDAVLKVFGTILIVMTAVFLVVAGYSNTQITPVMGLLGTVAGYVLGKETRGKQE